MIAPSTPLRLARVAAFVLLAAAGCKKSEETDGKAASPPPPRGTIAITGTPPPVHSGPRVVGRHYALDIAPNAGCKAKTTCSLTLRLETTGEYHINKEYPYSFVANPSSAVQFEGGDALGVRFARASGDFKEDGERAGTMTVRFTPHAAGPVTIEGTYKFSVCSDEHCEIDSQRILSTVPVS